MKNFDQSEFFQFARALVWCDGDYDEQEVVIKERVTAKQMAKFDIDN